MPELNFEVLRAEVVRFAAAPMLAFKLGIGNAAADEPVHSVVLRCQIQIEVARRRYTAGEQEKLRDLFGEPHRWGETLRNMLWTHATVVAPSFTGKTVVDLHAPCTFDFNVAATKYFDGVESGEIPLCLLFSGSAFYTDHQGALQVSPIPWDREARFRLPVATWKEMMNLYYPNSVWLCLSRDAFDRLYHYKVRHGIATWEQALDRVLPAVEEPAPL